MNERGRDDVVQARRIELVDGQGRLRGVLGEIEKYAPSDEPVVGLELYEPGGETRLSLAMGTDSSWVLLELGGNAQVHVGVNEEGGDAVDTRTFFFLCDAHGAPVVGWRVRDDGSVEEVRS